MANVENNVFIALLRTDALPSNAQFCNRRTIINHNASAVSTVIVTTSLSKSLPSFGVVVVEIAVIVVADVADVVDVVVC